MIKCLARGGAKTVLCFGLSRANIERLIAGDPIVVDAGQMDPKLRGLHLTVFFGETDLEMRAMLEEGGLIGPDTRIMVDPKLK